MPIEIKKGERETDFIPRCVSEEVSSGKESDQAVAICYSYWRDKQNMSQQDKFISRMNEMRMVQQVRLAEQPCPPATQDIKLNLENRQIAIDTAMYGPLDIKNPGDYWKEIADKWEVDEETARGEVCGNCAAFNVTTKMLECIAEGIGTEPSQDPYDVIEAGDLGYCEIFKFKCNANRSCFAHIDGGPITD